MAILDDAEHVMPIGDEIIRASGQLNASVEGFQLVNAAGIAVRAVPPIARRSPIPATLPRVRIAKPIASPWPGK